MFGSMYLDNLNGNTSEWFPFYHSAMAYTRSKLANVLFAKELARRLEGELNV
jgi:NAD(P)-dependent dehydrogenase (short-subunit alcohol dehydrogenase family)